ncbi:hypothetical protein Krad_4373 [Kineococcus radiotolerans SRS30216 = ATCC BAA-149]|uniref:DUF2510 domain-containing protein n=2 Tax=Kineococcus radiotolerans TaxID=131568 RepID=A6WG97_KINRD|nr:hypothetical protein Krad_4373 [Kineococcus radiotolerans SRS30216 = ATCC BAA-149]
MVMSQSGPVYSPDGRHLWDGQQWVPIASSTFLPSQPTAAAPWYRKQIASPGMVMIMLVIVVLLGGLMVHAAQEEQKSERQSHYIYCQTYGEGDLQC